MRTSTFIAILAGIAAAQRPENTSICDYYTTALLKDNTATNQASLLTLIVNTVVVGNYTKPEIPGVTFPDIVVPGLLANTTYQGVHVNLLPYLNGGLAIANRGGDSGVAINFLDDGGAAPLRMNKPSNGNEQSNQYLLLIHLYQYFGYLLGCSQQGQTGFSSYQGSGSLYRVHKFMHFDTFQVGYFISQVGLAAKSFGVADSDITAVATTLEALFDVRCAPPTVVVKEQGPQLQSVCIAPNCKLSPNATCEIYSAAVVPGVANSTLAMGEGNSSSTATASYVSGGSSASSTASESSPATATPSLKTTSSAADSGTANLIAAGVLALLALFL